MPTCPTTPPTARSCTAGVVLSVRPLWVAGADGCPVQITVTQTQTATCEPITTYTLEGAPWAGSTIAVEPPTHVVVCSTSVPVTGVDCDGAPVVAAGTLTVPHPTAVQLVKICGPTSDLEREYATLCAPDGTRVLVVTAWDTTAPLATPPTVEAYTLAGAPYTGDLTLLTDCALEKLDIVSEEYCVGGLQYERVSFYDVNTTPPVLSATLWRDASGASVADPGVGVVGKCPAFVPERKVLIYLERNGGVVAMSDIVAAVGVDKVQSVTVKQISGTGQVTADAGSGVPLSTGETWSWSAITGTDFWDFLGASALTMDAGGGEQRITATYIP